MNIRDLEKSALKKEYLKPQCYSSWQWHNDNVAVITS